MPGIVDGKYYQVARPSSIAEKLLIAARDRIFDDFLERMKPLPDSRIVDVGVSDVVSEGANVLERKYQYRHNITACGIGEAAEFQTEFPDVRYIRIEANAALPFPDNHFDIATANAVLEHVGSVGNQQFFVRELLRVANRAFISVPHRFFPVEHHTAIPLLHFTDIGFRIATAATGKSSWADQANLILMTKKKLLQLAAGLNSDVAVDYTGLKLGPLSSNLFLTLQKKTPAR